MHYLMLAALVLAQSDAEIQTVAGQRIVGPVASISDESITVGTGEAAKTMPTTEVLSLVLSPPVPASDVPAAWIALTDGSLLTAKSYVVSGAEAKIALPTGSVLTLPTKAIDNVRLRNHNEALATQWSEISKADRSADLLVVRKNDALDFLSGIVRDVSEEHVQFELDGETLRVKRPKVDGIYYHAPPAAALAAARGVVTDRSGARLQVVTLGREGDVLRARTPAGAELSIPWSEVQRIDFSHGNLQYLGDLQPESIRWTPYLGEGQALPAATAFFQPAIDQSVDGGPLRLGGRDYAKGLAAYSRTEWSFRLPKNARAFQTTAGIDDRLRPHGNVRLIIQGDNRPLFDETLTGKDAARSIDLDLTGVSRLTILVDAGAEMEVGDVLDLCEARILK